MIRMFRWAIAPPRCPICNDFLGGNESQLCSRCREELQPVTDTCPSTGLRRVTFFPHHGHVRAAILALKFGGATWRGLRLGRVLASQPTLRSHIDFQALLPIPLHRRRLASRGFNQSERIARGMGKNLKLPVDISSLRRKIHGREQARETRQNRLSRTNPFSAVSGTGNVAIIDDVLTTGTTLAQAAKTLHNAGYNPTQMIAVARTEGP